jgi:hypothetical protein
MEPLLHRYPAVNRSYNDLQCTLQYQTKAQNFRQVYKHPPFLYILLLYKKCSEHYLLPTLQLSAQLGYTKFSTLTLETSDMIIYGPRIFALRFWERQIEDLLHDPTVQACSMTTGRILYFALPIPVKALDLLDPQELGGLFRHLEGTLGLLIQTTGPHAIDYIAALMRAILDRISMSDMSLPVPTDIPICLAVISQTNAGGKVDPHIIAWINSAFQGHPPSPFQHYPSGPHPLSSNTDEEGLLKHGLNTVEHMERAHPRDYDLSASGGIDIIRDLFGERENLFVPNPFSPDQDTFFAWKEHQHYNSYDMDTMRRINSLSMMHAHNREAKCAQTRELRPRFKSPAVAERWEVCNDGSARNLEPQDRDVSWSTRLYGPPPSKIVNHTCRRTNVLHDFVKNLTEREMEFVFSQNACVSSTANDGCFLLNNTTAEQEHLRQQRFERADSRRAFLRGVAPTNTSASPATPIKGSDSIILPENEQSISQYHAKYREYLREIGHELTNEQMQYIFSGIKNRSKFMGGALHDDFDDDEILQRMLRLTPAKSWSSNPGLNAKGRYLKGMSKAELSLYCMGVFDVISDERDMVCIESLYFPGLKFPGNVWKTLLANDLPSDDWLLSLGPGKLTQFHEECIEYLKDFGARMQKAESHNNPESRADLPCDAKTRTDYEGPTYLWLSDSSHPHNSPAFLKRLDSCFCTLARVESNNSAENVIKSEDDKELGRHPMIHGTKTPFSMEAATVPCLSSRSSSPKLQNQTHNHQLGHNSPGHISSPDMSQMTSSVDAFFKSLTDYEMELLTKGIMLPERDDSVFGWRLVPAAGEASRSQGKSYSAVRYPSSDEKSKGNEKSVMDMNEMFRNHRTVKEMSGGDSSTWPSK